MPFSPRHRVGAPRSITNASRATAKAGGQFSFVVTTTGTPTPSLKRKGKLPKGLRLHDHHDGTASISGTPRPVAAARTYAVTILASYGRGGAKLVTAKSLQITVVP